MKEETLSNAPPSLSQYLGEIFRHRDLLWLLALKDIKVRFNQMFLGLLWVFVGPAFMIGVFTLVFHKGANFSGGLPYPLFAATGMLVYNYFSFLVSNGGTAILDNQALIQKVYFPRIILVLAKGIAGLVDLLGILILIVAMVFYFSPDLGLPLLFLPVIIIGVFLCALTGAIWMAILTTRFRDLKEFIPFALGAGFFLTPVVYPVTLIPKEQAWLSYLNPLSGLIEGFRWCLGAGKIPHQYSLVSLFVVLALFFIGLFVFKSVEGKLADQI